MACETSSTNVAALVWLGFLDSVLWPRSRESWLRLPGGMPRTVEEHRGQAMSRPTLLIAYTYRARVQWLVPRAEAWEPRQIVNFRYLGTIVATPTAWGMSKNNRLYMIDSGYSLHLFPLFAGVF